MLAKVERHEASVAATPRRFGGVDVLYRVGDTAMAASTRASMLWTSVSIVCHVLFIRVSNATRAVTYTPPTLPTKTEVRFH